MLLEPALGEVFGLDGKKYKCVECEHCMNCAITVFSKTCEKLQCGSLQRKDRTSVAYKQVTDELG